MRMSGTLFAYIARQFLGGVAGVFLTLLCLIFVFDLVELMRRSTGKDAVTAWMVLQMALLKLPKMQQEAMPFSILFGGMFAFWRLTRSNELVVARSAGISVWQFLLPALSISAAIGVIQVGLLSPISSAMLAQFERMEGQYFRGQVSALSVSSNGLWLRQGDDVGQAVIHAKRMDQTTLELQNVIVFQYEGADKFVRRLDAATGRLGERVWHLKQVYVSQPDVPTRFVPSYELPTDLTVERIQDSFASPETMSFWDLRGFIATLEKAGFTAHRHRLHFHAQLAVPLLLCAMVLLAATFSLRPTRRGGTGFMVLGGIVSGFMLFFVSDIVFALGLSATIPVILAAWTPAGVSSMLGAAMLLHLEDG
jgi:lipopolysaccharide export system permease protein